MRRIRRDKTHEEFIQELSSGEGAIFKDLWRVLLFSAMVGFSQKRRVALKEYDSGKAMPDSYFANSPAWPGVLYLLGLVEAENTSVMGSNPEDQDRLITIFEEYANGGLYFLQEFLGPQGDRLKKFVDLIQQTNYSKYTSEPNLNFDPV